MKAIVIILFVLLGFKLQAQQVPARSASTVAGVSIPQTSYYVQSKGEIRKVENSDPERIKVKEWRVRLYRRGAPRTGNSNWGSISGPSAAAVMDKLKAGQEFELRSNAFFGKGRVQDEICTHFNPLGPIAILDEDNVKQSKIETTKENVVELNNRLGRMRDSFNQIKQTVSTKVGAGYAAISKPFQDFTNDFNKAVSDVKRVQNMVANFMEGNIEEIIAELSNANSQLNNVEEQGRQLKTSFSRSTGSTMDPSLNVTGTNEEKIEALTKKLVELTNELTKAAQNENTAAVNMVSNKMIAVLRALIGLYAQDPDLKGMSQVLQQQLNALEEAYKS